MTAHRSPPSETEIDQLLASRIKATTPEFETRWRDQLRQWRTAPAPRAWWQLPRGTWLGLMGTGAVVAAWLLVVHPTPSARPPEFSETFQQLVAMDQVLARALPLIDAENRDALLHLPANATPSP